jgi:hypothetical protein
MTYSAAYPQIRVGGVGGLQTEDPTLAYGKYNVHTHDRVTPPDFRCYNVNIGDAVYVYNDAAEEILATVVPATITYIAASTLRLTVSAVETVVNGTLYVRNPQTSATVYCIHGINLSSGSNLVTFYTSAATQDFQQLDGAGLAGFVRPADWARVSTYSFSGVLDVTAPVICPVVLSLPNSSWIQDLYLKSVGFASSVRLRAGATVVGATTPTTSNVLTNRIYSQSSGALLSSYPSSYLTGPLAAGTGLDLEIVTNTGTGKLYYQLVLKLVVV